jgi:hypothetical protein
MENSGIILGNKILDVVFLAWFVAQFYKVIHSIILEKRINISRLWETGGMPSSHTATVSSLTTAVGITYGLQSPIFAVSIVFAIVVMSDAAGIRRAAGKHAGILNRLHDSLKNLLENKFHQEELKELLGHTPIEVLVGAILGVGVALIMYSNIFS